MKHAYLIIANKNHNQVQLLIDTLDDKRNDVYLLVDQKSNWDNIDFFTKHSKLIRLPSLPIFWGNFSLIQAEFNLFKVASKYHYDYYHLISGADLPLTSQNRIHNFFDQHPHHQFLTYSAMIDPEELKLRIRPHLFRRSYRNQVLPLRIYRKFEKKVIFGLFSQDKRDQYLGFASNWVSLDDLFVQKLVASEDIIHRFFDKGYLVDELMVPTLLNLYPEFKETVYHATPVTDKPDELQGSLRYINWWDGKPYIWCVQDFDKLQSAVEHGHFFSRKFDMQVDSKIIDKIVANDLDR